MKTGACITLAIAIALMTTGFVVTVAHEPANGLNLLAGLVTVAAYMLALRVYVVHNRSRRRR